jgi:transposase
MTIINWELYKLIRDFQSEGKSQREVASLTGLSRATVSEYWDGKRLPGERRKTERPESAFRDEGEDDPLTRDIMKLMGTNSSIYTKKQNLNAASIYRVFGKQYNVSLRTMQRIVARIEMRWKTRPADLILEYKPGEVMQVDWCEVKVILKGVACKFPVFCAVLPYSSNCFAKIYPDMTLPSFIDGHNSAFEYFGGVTENIWYDNLKCAVLCGHGKNAIFQENFKQYAIHNQFNPVAMNKGNGNEKGAVEDECKIAQQRFFTPLLEGDSLEEIQEQVYVRNIDYREKQKVKGKNKTVKEYFINEMGHIKPRASKIYEIPLIEEVKINDSSVFIFMTNKYSVPERYIGERFTIKILPYRIEAWRKGELIAVHNRLYGKNDRSLNPFHILNTLLSKPRATRNSAALNNYKFPEPMAVFASHYGDLRRNTILVQLMTIQTIIGEAKLMEILKQAIEDNDYTLDHIINVSKVNAEIIKNIDKRENIVVPDPEFDDYKFTN